MKLTSIPLLPFGIILWLLGWPTNILPQIVVNVGLIALLILDILRVIIKWRRKLK